MNNHRTIFYRRILIMSLLTVLLMLVMTCAISKPHARTTLLFNKDWKFNPGEVATGHDPAMDDSNWRSLDLPHDWSIEGEFSEHHPSGAGGGALPGGIGWYRKTFTVPVSDKDKYTVIEFDGVYRNSEVWLNGHYLGKRPYGYSSFRYDLTLFLKYGGEENIIAVRVDNSRQPNSRWYSGSGIYRNVRLVTAGKIHVDHWGTYITTPRIDQSTAAVVVKTKVRNATDREQHITLTTRILDEHGKEVDRISSEAVVAEQSVAVIPHDLVVNKPVLWSVEQPNLYSAITTIDSSNHIIDDYKTTFGIRSFSFDVEKGFILNGKTVKINGVCNHHDLGCLGAAVNERAIERQLEILKEMGCNGIRTSHNPPAPELLDLCDKMGFIVMDEAFDIWAKKKTEYDYHLDFDAWHKRDLEDMVLRDRNHPSVFVWSIGNEVMEQWDREDSSGSVITRELAAIVRNLDSTRPVTAACNGTDPLNPLFVSGALDVIGFNYHIEKYADFPENFPAMRFNATETVSSLATRGSYDMPSDSIRRWPERWDIPFNEGNPDYTCSSYDNCSAPWGSTHEETWRIVRKYGFISGMYIWTGFDYLGEPTPYSWPARSSYFGIIDLAGFPKDAYYFYQSEWTDSPVLHIFPHWNWEEGQTIDVWAYTNCEEVELFLNEESRGSKRKAADDLHLVWPLVYKPGTLIAVGRNGGKEILIKEVRTASAPAKITLESDRADIRADGNDLSFITVKILDEEGILVPRAGNMVYFKITGPGKIAGVDNGSQTSHEPFKAEYRKAFNGQCLAVIQSDGNAGRITLEATSEGLKPALLTINAD